MPKKSPVDGLLLVSKIFQFGPQAQKKISKFCNKIVQNVNFTKQMFFIWSAKLI